MDSVQFKKGSHFYSIKKDYSPFPILLAKIILRAIKTGIKNYWSSALNFIIVHTTRKIRRITIVALDFLAFPCVILAISGIKIFTGNLFFILLISTLFTCICVLFTLPFLQLTEEEIRENKKNKEDKESLTLNKMLSIDPETLLKKTRATLLSNPTKRGNALYEIKKWKFKTIEKPRILAYTCPSTLKLYCKFVPNDRITNPDLLQAEKFGLSLDEYYSISKET